MVNSNFVFKPQKQVIVRNYKIEKLTDICWQYEQADISYKMAVNAVKLHCSLNTGLAELRLFEALSKRGNRLPMAETRILTENKRQEASLNIKREVETIFRESKRLRS